MSRRLDIGIASYRKTDKLIRTMSCLINNSVTDFRCFVVDCASGPETREIIADISRRDSRIVPVYLDENIGYAGAVNKILNAAETEYIGFLDDDAYIQTSGWDEKLCSYLDRFHELAMVFPNSGHYMLNRGAYSECLWAAGFCWVITRLAQRAVGLMDMSIGHHEEVDLCTRLRLEGYKLGCAPEVQVTHDESATRDPASQERINRGVVRWMDKWVAYFCGKGMNYHSPNVLRVTDWPPHALYLEEYYKLKLPGLNAAPATAMIDGVEMDLISIPKPKGFYAGRVA